MEKKKQPKKHIVSAWKQKKEKHTKKTLTRGKCWPDNLDALWFTNMNLGSFSMVCFQCGFVYKCVNSSEYNSYFCIFLWQWWCMKWQILTATETLGKITCNIYKKKQQKKTKQYWYQWLCCLSKLKIWIDWLTGITLFLQGNVHFVFCVI